MSLPDEESVLSTPRIDVGVEGFFRALSMDVSPDPSMDAFAGGRVPPVSPRRLRGMVTPGDPTPTPTRTAFGTAPVITLDADSSDDDASGPSSCEDEVSESRTAEVVCARDVTEAERVCLGMRSSALPTISLYDNAGLPHNHDIVSILRGVSADGDAPVSAHVVVCPVDSDCSVHAGSCAGSLFVAYPMLRLRMLAVLESVCLPTRMDRLTCAVALPLRTLGMAVVFVVDSPYYGTNVANSGMAFAAAYAAASVCRVLALSIPKTCCVPLFCSGGGRMSKEMSRRQVVSGWVTGVCEALTRGDVRNVTVPGEMDAVVVYKPKEIAVRNLPNECCFGYPLNRDT